jgi:uncharacterized protein
LGGGGTFAPTGERERVAVVDALRGIAVLGILAANLEYFRTPEVWGGYEGTRSTLEAAYFFLVAFLTEGKFITALSLLFGFGLAAQLHRARRAGRPARRFLLRRLLVLALFGAAHALLVWSGDVLLFYAALGLPLLLFLGLRPGALVFGACAVILVGLVLVVLSYLPGSLATELGGRQANLAPGAQGAFASGSLAEMTVQRAREYATTLPLALIVSAPQVFAMMLLGAAAANSASFESGLGRRARRVALLGLAAGLPLNLLYALYFELGVGVRGETWYYLLSLAAWFVGAPILALGWMGLAAVGRMALTNYLAQSLIMTTFFYWLGFYGRTGVAVALLLMLGVWALELLWSRPWLSRFRYGPFEWLWRRLSYGRPRGDKLVS